MDLAPIVLFVYNRPWHTRQTLEALSKNDLAEESELFIFSDGPVDNLSEEEHDKILEVRRIVEEKKWCKKVNLILSEKNKGIEESTFSGVTRIINEYGKVIVLEDDLITSSYFLSFINKGLHIYEESKNVYSINGYMFPIITKKHESVLLPLTSSWGWATWKNRWEKFEKKLDLKDIILNNSHIYSRFNLADLKYTDILALDTWDIHWYYSVFIRNGLGLFPSTSLVKNIGFDGSGVHYTEKITMIQQITNNKIEVTLDDKIDLEFYDLYLRNFEIRKKRNLLILIYEKIFSKSNL